MLSTPLDSYMGTEEAKEEDLDDWFYMGTKVRSLVAATSMPFCCRL